MYKFKKDIKYLFQIFHKYNYEIYLVGGCVRDYLLNRDIHDYDMCTNAYPEETIEICKKENIKYFLTGLKHGTITIRYNHENYEVTTFRKDGDYLDNRHPNEVTFTRSIQEDSNRRDFTINALYMDEDKIYDFHNGINDLNNKIIKCVNDPDTRFKEDALRILRALRFSYQLNFNIEENTYKSIQENSHLLNNISKERIQEELNKILLSDTQDLIIKLKDANVLLEIIPEYELTYDVPQETPYHIYDVFHHMNAVNNATVQMPLDIKLACFLHDIEKKNYKTIDDKGIAHFKGHAHGSAITANKILKRLKYPNKTIDKVYKLIDYHDTYPKPIKKHLQTFMYKLDGDFDLMNDILTVQIMDNMGKNPIIVEEKNKMIGECLTILKQMQEDHECYCIKDLKVNGKDMMKIGFKNEQIGIVLDYLLKNVIHEQKNNNYEILMKLARKQYELL